MLQDASPMCYVIPNHMKPFSQECLGPQIPFSMLHILESNVTQVDTKILSVSTILHKLVYFEGPR